MDLGMAMDMNMMNHELLLHTISQLDSALTYLSSPSASPPPPQPPVLVPSNPPPVTTTPVLLPPQAAVYRPEHTATRQLVGVESAADADADAARPRRRNVRVSSEPQSVAARLRRERVSQRMRALQRLVPGGARLDTASMLDEAIRYVRFLKSHVQALEQAEAAAAATMHGRVDHAVVATAAAGDLYSCSYHA